MKKMLMTLALFASVSSFAKMTVYSNTSALQAVLSDTETMSKISTQMSGSELTNTQIISSGEGISKSFTIRMTYTAKTPIGDRSCYTDVAVQTQPSTVNLHGGVTIDITKLVIKKISHNICEK